MPVVTLGTSLLTGTPPDSCGSKRRRLIRPVLFISLAGKIGTRYRRRDRSFPTPEGPAREPLERVEQHRAHQNGASIATNGVQHMGRSRGGLTSKIHAVVDTNGLPVQLDLRPDRESQVRNDSSVEGDGFELSVPGRTEKLIRVGPAGWHPAARVNREVCRKCGRTRPAIPPES